MNSGIVMHGIGEDTYRYARYALAHLCDTEDFRKSSGRARSLQRQDVRNLHTSLQA